MNQFFKFLFASCLGTLLALVLLIFIGGSVIGALTSALTEKEKVTVGANSVLWLEFNEAIPDKTDNVESSNLFEMDRMVLGLQDMVRSISHAKTDPNIKGVYINAGNVTAGKATTAALRRALADFKTSGKFVVAYADYYTQNAYYLASVADSVLLNPVGMVEFKGLGNVTPFFKGMLDKMDIQMRIFYAGKFKSATEPFRLEKMSDENKLQLRELLGDMQRMMIQDVAASRRLPEAEVQRIAAEFSGRNSEAALQNHLVDRVVHEDEAFDVMKRLIGLESKEKMPRIPIADYFKSAVRKTNITIKDKVAILYAEGEISDGKDEKLGQIVDGPYVKMLRKIRNDDQVKALVLRVNSPGGSVLASENIYREVQLCKAAGKPVVVSMGDYAASGGYYIACLADSIFAEPATLTGSIGVFGLVPMLDKTLKNKLGITFDTVKTTPFSTFGSVVVDFSPAESQMMQANVERTYQQFLGKVAAGRKMTVEQVHEIAQGRVWSGQRAQQIGLVDAVGDLDRAVRAAAALSGLSKYRPSEYPTPKTQLEQLMDQFSKTKHGDEVFARTVRTEMGSLYPLYQSLQQMQKLKGIQARLPYVLMFD